MKEKKNKTRTISMSFLSIWFFSLSIFPSIFFFQLLFPQHACLPSPYFLHHLFPISSFFLTSLIFFTLSSHYILSISHFFPIILSPLHFFPHHALSHHPSSLPFFPITLFHSLSIILFPITFFPSPSFPSPFLPIIPKNLVHQCLFPFHSLVPFATCIVIPLDARKPPPDGHSLSPLPNSERRTRYGT